MFTSRVRVFTSRRIGTEEFHRALLGVQFAECVGNKLVFDVSICIHDEAVVTQSASFGRP